MHREKFHHFRCVHACRPPYTLRQPCPACKTRHDQWMDEAFQEHVLEQEHAAVLRILPATDREWLSHCDQVAPVVDVVPEMDLFFFTLDA